MWPWCWRFTHSACFNEWNSFSRAAVEQSLTNKCYIWRLPSLLVNIKWPVYSQLYWRPSWRVQSMFQESLWWTCTQKNISVTNCSFQSEKQKRQRKSKPSGSKTVIQEMDPSVIISTAFCIFGRGKRKCAESLSCDKTTRLLAFIITKAFKTSNLKGPSVIIGP